jgi:acyl carrier protein
MTLKRSIVELIEANLAGRASRVQVTETTPLIEAGLIDSIGLMQIVAHIEERTGVTRAIGMTADLARRQAVLHAQVQGEYAP